MLKRDTRGSVLCRKAKIVASCIVLIICLANPLYAQHPPSPERDTSAMWHVGLGYPETVFGGVSIVVGRTTPSGIPGRGRSIQGVLAGADCGVGGTSIRIAWADLYSYDAGIEGWSYEAVYARTWLLRWGLPTGASYVGAGITRYLGPIRTSGALLTNTDTHGLAATGSANLILRFQ